MTKTILVVEDERALSEAIEKGLKKSSFNVITVSSASAAKEVLGSGTKIHGIWLDHYLLGKDTGLDLLYEIKGNNDWKNIPVFVVTNSVGDEKVATYELLSIEKYFVKSNNSLAEIVGSVKEVLA